MDATSLLTQTSTQQAQSSYADALNARALAAHRANGQSMEKVRDAAQQFEAFFVGQMMEYMTAGIKPDETFGGGQAESTWRSMLNQEYGKQVAKSGRLGISDQVMRGMLKAQEQRTAAAAALNEAAAPVAPVPEIAPQNLAAAIPVTPVRSVLK